jgi:N-methylhydantoinase A/oxoprolinase/acetone carboxylase beta subunit
MARADLRIAVDLGSTHADGVVLDDGDHVLADAKVPRGPDVAAGVRAAVRRLAEQRGVDRGRVTRTIVGCGAAHDAVLACQGLCRVAVVRIGAPLTTAVPPLSTWPAQLREAVSCGTAVVQGGADYDGRAAGPLDEDALASFLASVAGRAEAVAITSVFSAVAPDQELAAADVARRELGGVPVSLSHEIGSVGLLARENLTVLNAALLGVAERLASSLREALDGSRIDAELFFAQGDGTVMALEHALRFPALMLGNASARAMRGAAWLTGIGDAVVVDVGAGATAVGVLINGSPRETSPPAHIAGIRADLRTADVAVVPIGGGTIVRLDGGTPLLGDRSPDEGLVFGGATPTLTDAAVAAGRAVLGSRGLTMPQRRALTPALELSDRALAEAVDRARRAAPAATLVAVGGGAMLVPRALPGISDMIVPRHGAVAGAIGLANAPAAGEAHRICANRPTERATTMEAARADAVAQAIHAGAAPAQVQIVELEEIPLSYLHDPPIRIRVKAAGPLGSSRR